MIEFLEGLNEAQREAVTAPLQHQLVLAGAGSGKTRVLTHRIAWLIEHEGLSPYQILAVTFTNKAAAEMRARVGQLLQIPTQGLWLGTFHSIAHRLLRQHYKQSNLPENFQILDSDDQLRIIKRVIKALNLDEEKWPAKQAQWYINDKKDKGLRARHLSNTQKLTEETLIKIYEEYETACERGSLVDFAELLLRSHELWRDNAELLQHYQQRFRALLVDEFQDTNQLQYAWLKLLAGNSAYLTIVGDDDQSIYGWRGAKVENILEFEQQFPRCQVVRLEQNYRSTETILKAANAVIGCNDTRLGKELWTQRGQGEPISVYAAFNDLDEARFIVARIKEWADQGHPYNEIAVLYRSNAQSRVLEEALLHQQIPYRVYGGLRFFERAEIKDALAYLRLMENHDDDAAFERIINTPTRGIGEKTLEHLRIFARSDNCSLWCAAEKLLASAVISGRVQQSIHDFLKLIHSLKEDTCTLSLHEQTDLVIQGSGLLEHYRKEKGEKAQMRLDNLGELVTAARQFDPHEIQGAEDLTPLQAFLSHAALESGEQTAEGTQASVQLMTLHSAKGLEFPLIFIAGIEEGLFPHAMSAEDPNRLEEERRLCYVGITRAMQKLYFTYAETRRWHGREVYHTPSRFLREIPKTLLNEVRLRNKPIQRPVTYFTEKPRAEDSTQGWQLGQSVQHPTFGKGIILNAEGRGEQARVQVKFAIGTKWLMLNYAKLMPI